MRQVLDGPPDVVIRRLSTFLLIPVGLHRRGFAFYRSYLAFRKLSLESHAWPKVPDMWVTRGAVQIGFRPDAREHARGWTLFIQTTV